jgi:hypothetical protein
MKKSFAPDLKCQPPNDLSETDETGWKSAIGETDDSSRSEVRGFRNVEPGTSNRAFLASRAALHHFITNPRE